MNRDEAIDFIKRFSKAAEKLPIHADIMAPLHEAFDLAVADMKAAIDLETWVEWPNCPTCGKPLHCNHGTGNWSCSHCEKHVEVETMERYRVKQ